MQESGFSCFQAGPESFYVTRKIHLHEFIFAGFNTVNSHIRGRQGLDDPNVFFLPGSLSLFFQHSAQSAFTTAGLTMEQLKTAV